MHRAKALGPLIALLPALAAAAPPAATATAVLVAEARTEPLAERVEALGTLKANESVAITSNVTETISAIHFDDGQRVRQGQTLVEMTSAEEQALLGEAQARVAEAEQQYQRVKSLAAQRSASESLLDERRRDLETARAMLVAIESRLADRLIRAPFDGVLGLRNISRGALVEPGDLITTLDDDSLMKLDFTVPSVYLGSLEPGLRIEARARPFGDQSFDGVIRGIDSRVDPVTRAIGVRALLPNPERLLKPGLLMQVDLLVNPRDAVVVPESALLHQGREHYLAVVVDADGAPTVERRKVQTGIRVPGLVEITEGLVPGEVVVTDGNDKVRPGQPVQILNPGGEDTARSGLAGDAR